MSDWYDAARTYIKTKALTTDNSFAGLMAAWFKAGAPSTNGGAVVTSQAAPAQLTAAPTESDFNGLLTKLIASGVLH